MNIVGDSRNVLYLIGGAARSGKTKLTQRLYRERCVPYFCVDYYVSGLQEGAPQLGVIGESPNMVHAPRLWPLLVGTLRNIIEVEPQYAVDGDALWPQGAASLIAEYPGQVRACFIGYAQTTPERKLAEIRRYSGGVNDWIQDHTDAYILNLVNEMISFSRFIQSECAAQGLPYFDISEDFNGNLEQAYRSLISPTSGALHETTH